MYISHTDSVVYIWSPLFINLYIQLFPTVVKHCLLIGYADDHTLLKIISQKSDRYNVAAQINADLNQTSMQLTKSLLSMAGSVPSQYDLAM